MRSKAWVIVWIVIVFSLLLGCKDKGLSDGATDAEPPGLTVLVGETVIESVLGTYSWSYVNEDGSESGLENDSLAPPGLVADQRVVKVAPNTEVELEFEREPDHYKVNIWDEDDTILSSSDEVDLSGRGKVVYEIVARYGQGNVRYAFAVKIE